MLVKEALSLAASELEEFSSKQLEARILLAHILNLTQENLLLSYNKEISKSDKDKFFKLIERRKSFEPIAYIIGKKEFYALEFLVNENVLIPRNDTELLVETVIKETITCCNDYKVIKILELGSGSGAIAISLAKNISNALVVATDISDEALEISQKNAKLNNVMDKITFIQSDWYKNLDINSLSEQFDFIVSNPPYIRTEDRTYMSKETILYEPTKALFADDNGLANYKEIIASADKFLKKSGRIILEIGFNQARLVKEILQHNEFTNIEIFPDLQGIERVIMGAK